MALIGINGKLLLKLIRIIGYQRLNVIFKGILKYQINLKNRVGLLYVCGNTRLIKILILVLIY